MTGVGQMLADAREARRISIEQAERDTRIGRRYLLALEAEEFSAFPARVYSRGFLRSYASYLGLNPADLLALLPEETPKTADTRRPRGGRSTPRPPRPPRVPELLTEGGGAEQKRTGPRDPSQADLLPPALRAGAQRVWEQARMQVSTRLPRLQQRPVLPLAGGAVGLLVIVLVLGRCVAGGGDEPPGANTTAPGDPPTPAFAPLPNVKRRMPDVRGMDEGTALGRLRELGLDAVVIELPSRDAPAGQVVRQSPPPNQEIGTTIVTVVISRGG